MGHVKGLDVEKVVSVDFIDTIGTIRDAGTIAIEPDSAI